MTAALLELRDLWNPDQLQQHVAPLREKNPTLHLTCYGMPNRLGPVTELRREFPYVTFGIQGFEGSPFECAPWTEDIARTHLMDALSMGYNAIFFPPGWVYDEETAKACKDLSILLRHHPSAQIFVKGLAVYPGPKDGRLKPTYRAIQSSLQPGSIGGWMGTHPAFQNLDTFNFNQFITPLDVAVEATYDFPSGGTEGPVQ